MEEVLLIDDDVELCTMLTDYLSRYNFRVTSIYRGDTGLQKAREMPWSIILLDVMLPGIDGFELLRQLRASTHVSVLLLTARGDDIDRIVGLEMGADDYLPKPFNPRELLARMRAILRRSSAAAPLPEQGSLRVGPLELTPATRQATAADALLDLTDVEFSLLEALMRAPGLIVSREQLSEVALGRRFDPLDRSVDMHMSRLRRKLGANSPREEWIKTIRGAGYQLIALSN